MQEGRKEGRKSGRKGGREGLCIGKLWKEDGCAVIVKVGYCVCLKKEMRRRREAATADTQWQQLQQRGGREKASSWVVDLRVENMYTYFSRVSPFPLLSCPVDNSNQSDDDKGEEDEKEEGGNEEEDDKDGLIEQEVE
jgi:hypothetical protein